MMINSLKIIGTYIILVIIFFFTQVFIVEKLDSTVSKDLLIKLYLVIGSLTLFFVIIGAVVRRINPNHIGSVFLAGMVAKMAVTLAFVYVNQDVRVGVYQLIIVYFLILFAEAYAFIKLLRDNL